MATSSKGHSGGGPQAEETAYVDPELSTFSQNVQAVESRLFRIEIALQAEPIDHNRIHVYLDEINSITRETRQQSQRAYEINGDDDPNVQRLLALQPRMVEIRRIAESEISLREENIRSIAAEKEAVEARHQAQMSALDAVTARIKAAVTHDDKVQALAAYEAYMREYIDPAHAPVDIPTDPPQLPPIDNTPPDEDDEGMEDRIKKLEDVAFDTNGRLVRIETLLVSIDGNMATKLEVQRGLLEMTWKLIGVATLLVAAVYYITTNSPAKPPPSDTVGAPSQHQSQVQSPAQAQPAPPAPR